jgi:DNA invertase Pin-like site-specific DNA recombinase
MKRIALYARVSTKNHGQDVEVQLEPLRTYARARGLDIVEEYSDVGISGSKDKRPALDKLMKDARARRIDGVLVARFDRFARSTRHLVTALDEFQALGVDFVSLNESVDTSTPMGRMIFTVLSAVGELEKNVIVERIHAGLANARRRGVKLGRKEVIVSKDAIASYRAEGKSYLWISEKLGVSVGKVHGIVSAAP